LSKRQVATVSTATGFASGFFTMASSMWDGPHIPVFGPRRHPLHDARERALLVEKSYRILLTVVLLGLLAACISSPAIIPGLYELIPAEFKAVAESSRRLIAIQVSDDGVLNSWWALIVPMIATVGFSYGLKKDYRGAIGLFHKKGDVVHCEAVFQFKLMT
jgi:hypothetical protein